MQQPCTQSIKLKTGSLHYKDLACAMYVPEQPEYLDVLLGTATKSDLLGHRHQDLACTISMLFPGT